MKNQKNRTDENPTPPETDQKKSLRKSWKSSGPVAKVTAVFAGLAALATAIYAVASVWQLIKLGESNRINREALESVQRAFVNSELGLRGGLLPPGTQGEQRILTVVNNWENSGTTPAIKVIKFFNIGKLANEPTETEFVGSKPISVITYIGPKGVIGDTETRPYSFYAEGKIFFWGWIVYRDKFPKTKPHLTEVCKIMASLSFHITPGSPSAPPLSLNPTVGMTYGDCTKHNCIDEDCEDYNFFAKLAP